MLNQHRCLALTSGSLCEAMMILSVYFSLNNRLETDLTMLFAIMLPIVTGVASLVFGAIGDKIQRIKLSRIAPLFLVCAACIAFSTLPTELTISALVISLSIFIGIEYSCTRTVIAESALPNHRFKWASEVIVFYNMGLVVALVWYTYFYGTSLAINGLFYLNAVLGIILTVRRWNIPNPKIQNDVLDTTKATKTCSFWRYLFTPRVALVTLFIGYTYILFSVVMNVLMSHQIYVNLGTTVTSFITFAACTIFAIQNIFCTFFPERARALYGVAALVFLVMMYMLQTHQEFVQGIMFAVIFGLLSGISPSLFYQQWIVEFTPTRYRSTMRGVFSFMTRICIGVGIYLTQDIDINNIFEISFLVCLVTSFFAVKHMPNSTGVTLSKVDAKFDPYYRTL